MNKVKIIAYVSIAIFANLFFIAVYFVVSKKTDEIRAVQQYKADVAADSITLLNNVIEAKTESLSAKIVEDSIRHFTSKKKTEIELSKILKQHEAALYIIDTMPANQLDSILAKRLSETDGN